MAKKNKKRDDDERKPDLPKFTGFNALAAGLGDMKAKMEAEERAGKKPAPPPPPRPPPPKKLTPAESLADELTFHRMMSGVTPLADRGSRVTVSGAARVEPKKVKQEDVRERAKREAEAVLDHLHHLVDDAVRFEVTDDGKRVEGRRTDVPPALVRELRRGVLPIDGRLDLHGHGAEDARTKLLDFLKAQRTRGERCVLVIHGKGDHSERGVGILRGEIAAWLSQGRAREHVAAFATAQPADGGEGAVYVALRR
ncbi:MAG: Smr/MutS family protein [Labilithrix sp.]|nr:Smr/MutS family protein [Labilithrix sp.]MCW5809661.1 Smr/MutS family protein [Labilithrix sp.]